MKIFSWIKFGQNKFKLFHYNKNLPPQVLNLIERIKNGQKDNIPNFVGMTCILSFYDNNMEEFWNVYLSHDPCHDSATFTDDRNTVVAISKSGRMSIIGRELNKRHALKIAKGLI